MVATVSEEKFLPSIADVSKAYHLDLNYNKLRGTMIQLEDYLELKTSSFYLISGQGEGRTSLKLTLITEKPFSKKILYIN